MAKEVKKANHKSLYLLVIIVLVLLAYVIWVFQFSYPDLRPTYDLKSFNTSNSPGNLSFPSYGQSAVGVGSYGTIATSGKDSPAPIASVAKLITALCVLKKNPVSSLDSSPVITLSSSDVSIYENYLSVGGSVVPVASGEKITEVQMLEGMMLPSANNMADSLAIWAFGSLSSYSSYANSFLSQNGLNSTHVGTDASGYDPSTVSTASDLIKLGQLVLANPLLKQIVSMPSANVPVAGEIKNVNTLLGKSGIDGIKTGNTTQAGGVFISSSVVTVNNLPTTVYTAVVGAPTLWQALNDSYKLITSAQANFGTPTSLASIKRGTQVGYYSVPWSDQVIEANAASNLPLETWNGDNVKINVALNTISDKSKEGVVTGSITASDPKLGFKKSINVYLSAAMPKPSRWWLLLHPTVALR